MLRSVLDVSLIPNNRVVITTIVGLATFLALKPLGRLLRTHVIVPKLTIMGDIPTLGTERKGGKIKGAAVICGGSLAGLFTAAVCHDHYESVVIVEADAWVHEHGTDAPGPKQVRITTDGIPAEINQRPRVMQFTSTHVHQPVTLMALRQLFPNFDEEAAALGIFPAPCDLKMYLQGTLYDDPYKAPEVKEATPETIYVSRHGFEVLLRRLVTQYRPNVKFVDGTVTGVIKDESYDDILTGVSVRLKDGRSEVIDAKLVVDCTGPTQAGFQKWFKSPLLPSNLRSQYDPNLFYTTASFHIPSHLQSKLPIPGGFGQKWLYSYFPDTEVENKSMIMGIVENDTLVLTAGGWMNRNLPHDIESIKIYLSTLIGGEEPIQPWVFEFLDVLGEHVDELQATYTDVKVPPCYYIRYHQAPAGAYPRNFVGVGDSVMKVNPVFAQGMAKSCIGAVTLGHILQNAIIKEDGVVPKSFSREFFKLHASRTDGIWDGTKGTDYGFSTTVPAEGESLGDGAGTRKFVKHALQLAKADHAFWLSMWRARMFLAPPTDALTPWVVIRVLWMMFWDRSS